MTFVMFITTLLITLAILVVWHHSIFVAIAFFLVFGLIDASFLSATLNKFTHGGWFPIALAGAEGNTSARHVMSMSMFSFNLSVNDQGKVPFKVLHVILEQSSQPFAVFHCNMSGQTLGSCLATWNTVNAAPCLHALFSALQGYDGRLSCCMCP